MSTSPIFACLLCTIAYFQYSTIRVTIAYCGEREREREALCKVQVMYVHVVGPVGS